VCIVCTSTFGCPDEGIENPIEKATQGEPAPASYNVFPEWWIRIWDPDPSFRFMDLLSSESDIYYF